MVWDLDFGFQDLLSEGLGLRVQGRALKVQSIHLLQLQHLSENRIETQSPELPRDSPEISPSRPTRDVLCWWKSRDTVICAKRRPVLAGTEDLFRSSSIDQNRSSSNWPLAKPLAKILQRHGDAETGLNSYKCCRSCFLQT